MNALKGVLTKRYLAEKVIILSHKGIGTPFEVTDKTSKSEDKATLRSYGTNQSPTQSQYIKSA